MYKNLNDLAGKPEPIALDSDTANKITKGFELVRKEFAIKQAEEDFRAKHGVKVKVTVIDERGK